MVFKEKERHHSYFGPLRKRLVLGTVIDKQGGADGRKARSRKNPSLHDHDLSVSTMYVYGQYGQNDTNFRPGRLVMKKE